MRFARCVWSSKGAQPQTFTIRPPVSVWARRKQEWTESQTGCTPQGNGSLGVWQFPETLLGEPMRVVVGDT